MMAAVAGAAGDTGEASLVGLIRAGDRLNRAILNHDEVQQAIGRLRNGGLVTVSDTGFALTDAGDRLVGEASRKGGGIGLVDRLLKALGRQPAVDRPAWLLSAAAYTTACHTYVHGR